MFDKLGIPNFTQNWWIGESDWKMYNIVFFFSADCPVEFVKSVRAMANDGKTIDEPFTLYLCKMLCVRADSCTGFDYDEFGAKCVLHTDDIRPLIFSTTKDNYKRMVDSCKNKISTYSFNLFRRYNIQFHWRVGQIHPKMHRSFSFCQTNCGFNKLLLWEPRGLSNHGMM